MFHIKNKAGSGLRTVDAAVGAFVDGDSNLGNTDGYSHRVTAGYQFTNAFNAAFAVFTGKGGIAGGAEGVARNKVHADLVFKF